MPHPNNFVLTISIKKIASKTQVFLGAESKSNKSSNQSDWCMFNNPKKKFQFAHSFLVILLQFLPYFCSFSLHAPPTFPLSNSLPAQFKIPPSHTVLTINNSGVHQAIIEWGEIVTEINEMWKKLGVFMRKCVFRVLSVGAIPNHIAFILDGNRRYAKKHNLAEGAGHRAGFLALMSILKYCSELSVKYVSIYAFSTDNFNRRHNEVQYLMDLMLEKMELLLQEDSFVSEYGVRICFIGNLGLLSEPYRVSAEKVMRATAKNNKMMIQICVAYSSTDEIIHAVKESCIDKIKNQPQAFKPCTTRNVVIEDADEHINMETTIIKPVDLEKHMYFDAVPDPDIIIRTSGEKRLSNFLLWQTSNCLLYAPAALWPEISLWHLVWATLNFQRNHAYLENKKKQI